MILTQNSLATNSLCAAHKVIVQVALTIRQTTHNNMFVFFRHLLLDFLFEATQQEGAYDLLEEMQHISVRLICLKTGWSIALQTLCRRLMSVSLYSILPSIMPVIGFENHSLNSRCDENTQGIRKCISDHSSIKSFCRGVPVSSKRLETKLKTLIK